MRCAECGRLMTNAEIWQLCNNPHAPPPRSMQIVCWDCRLAPPTEPRPPAEHPAAEDVAGGVVEQAIEVVRDYNAHL